MSDPSCPKCRKGKRRVSSWWYPPWRGKMVRRKAIIWQKRGQFKRREVVGNMPVRYCENCGTVAIERDELLRVAEELK